MVRLPRLSNLLYAGSLSSIYCQLRVRTREYALRINHRELHYRKNGEGEGSGPITGKLYELTDGYDLPYRIVLAVNGVCVTRG